MVGLYFGTMVNRLEKCQRNGRRTPQWAAAAVPGTDNDGLQPSSGAEEKEINRKAGKGQDLSEVVWPNGEPGLWRPADLGQHPDHTLC